MLAYASVSLPSLKFHHSQPLVPEVKEKRNLAERNPGNSRKRPFFQSKIRSFSNQGKILDKGGVLSDISLSVILKSCLSVKDVECLHSAAVRRFGSSVTFVWNNFITNYARFGDIGNARKIFDEMCERNVISWTAILHGYLNLGLDEEVTRLFRRMIESSVEPNSLTFVCLLKSCGNLLDFELGGQIHACLLKGNRRNMIVDSALVYFYAQCGDVLGASRVFHRMAARDVVSWTTMITAYVGEGHNHEAFSLFQEMQNHRVQPNEFTVCSVLKACGELKALEFGKQLHGAIIKGMLKADVYVGSSLVNMYACCGEVSDARIVFDLMPKRNTITWTSMISGYAQNGLGEEAILVFQKMKRRRVFANNLTIVSILSACTSVGSLCLGKEVHGQVIKNLLHGNKHIGSSLVSFYCKCGEYHYATRVLRSVSEKDVISWTSIISGYASLGYGSAALGCLSDMLLEGVEPNSFTYSSALKACSKLENVMCGKWIHASASKNRALSNVFVSSALIGMYMICGCTTDASRVFDTMLERNLVSWKVMVIGYAKNGLCNEALKLIHQMQEEGFFVDDFVFATVLNECGDLQCELKRSDTSCLLLS